MLKHRKKYAQPEHKDTMPDLREYDIILLNSSAGKDSQAMADYVCRLAREQGVKGRVVMVHADLGRVEWPGTRDLAELHATVYFNIPFFVVKRDKADLLDQIRERGMWPDSRNRYCTSDHKRDQVAKLMTVLVSDWRAANGNKQCRILNCMGIRAEESVQRAVKKPFQRNQRASNSKRKVDDWFPIFRWTESDVWQSIHASGIPYHYAYDLGMPRLSCAFCVFAGEDALMVSGLSNPGLLDTYVELETEIGHTFRHRMAIASIKQRLAAGERPGQVNNWSM